MLDAHMFRHVWRQMNSMRGPEGARKERWHFVGLQKRVHANKTVQRHSHEMRLDKVCLLRVCSARTELSIGDQKCCYCNKSDGFRVCSDQYYFHMLGEGRDAYYQQGADMDGVQIASNNTLSDAHSIL